VGSVLVVVPLVGGKDLSSMGLVRDEDVVEDLTPDAADDPFAVAFIRGTRGALLRITMSSAWKTPRLSIPLCM
jgi:hypothetical protein